MWIEQDLESDQNGTLYHNSIINVQLRQYCSELARLTLSFAP